MIKKILDYLFFRLSKRLGEQNLIEKGAQISPTAFLSGCHVNGQITIGDGCRLYKCDLNGNIQVGRYTSIWGPNITISSVIHSITIGNFCSIARNVSIQGHNHRMDLLSTYHIQQNIFGKSVFPELSSKGSIIIGHDVWIGAGAVILSGVVIGNGAVIGSNAVVTHDVPEFAVVAGNPAKIIKYRFSLEQINKINTLKWWDWPIDEIMKKQSLFTQTFI